MDSEQQGEPEEKAEEAATDEPKDTAKEANAGAQSEDAEKSTPAEDAEDKEVKDDEVDEKEGGDTEASTETKAEETTAPERDQKETEEEEKGEGQAEAKPDESAGKDVAPKKAKAGKQKSGKADKEKKSSKDKDTSSKKGGKAEKSPRKEGKKKGKKGAEAAKKEAPKEAASEEEGEEGEGEAPKETDDETASEKKSPEDEEEEETTKPISDQTSGAAVKPEGKLQKEVSIVTSETMRRPSSKASAAGKRASKRDRRSTLSKQLRVREPGEEEEEEEEPKEKDPFDIEGVVHLVISPEMQEKLHCTIGEQVTAESPWTVVDRKVIATDMRHKHSDFHSLRDQIKAYKQHEVLVGYQVASDIPNMFYVCLTVPAKTTIEEMLKNIEIEQKERVQKMMVRYAGEWQSLGSENEVDSWKIQLARPLLEVDIQVSTNKEKKPKIEDCDATVESDRYFKIGPSRVQPTNIERLRVDEGVQACPEKTLAYAQTYLPFPTNIWTQYLYEIKEEDIALTPELTQKLKEFMEHSYNVVGPVIAYNSHFDLYIDDYVRLVQSQRDLAKSKEILYKSYNIFFDVYRCKNKLITACDWHPMWSGIAAVAYAEELRSLCLETKPHEAEDILTAMGSSAALIWSFVDEINPKLILECPHRVHALRFCPHDENLLIGGCDNGQVVLWDLTDSLWRAEYEEVLTDDQKSYRISLNKHMTWMKRTTFNNIIRTSVTSYFEFSPQACITDVRWLSPYAQLSRLGRYSPNKDGQKSLQFITSSEDGAIYVWDLQAEVKGGPVKAHKKKRSVPEDLKAGLSKYKHLNLIFSPIFKIRIKDVAESGVMRLTFVETDIFPLTYSLRKALVPNKEYALNDRLFYTVSFQEPEGPPRHQLFLGTVEGHALRISWAGYETETGEAVSAENCKYTSYNGHVHDCPVTSVSRSPFVPDLVLTVSARVFAIWREDFKDEPLIWRKSAVKMSCGRWSLYRPSSFLICNYDGSITTWDLLLRSNSHVKEQTISGKVITAAHPNRTEPYQHIMAFNDFMGGLRVFTVPKAYMEYDEEDEAGLRHFFSREVKARDVFREWEKRWWEKNAYILEEEQAAREEMERRLKQEAEKQAKEEARRALEMEHEKKRKKKEKQESWTDRYQKKWEELQESNMMKVIMTLKHFRKSELLSKLQPLEALQEEEEKKNLKYKERLDQAQKLFEDLVYMLFPGAMETPQSVHRSAEILFSHLEEIPSRLLDVYQDLEMESLAYIQEHEFTYDFSWKNILNKGLERREALDEQVCPKAERNSRFREERQRVSALAHSIRKQAEEEGEVAREASDLVPEDEEEGETEEEGEEEEAEEEEHTEAATPQPEAPES